MTLTRMIKKKKTDDTQRALGSREKPEKNTGDTAEADRAWGRKDLRKLIPALFKL